MSMFRADGILTLKDGRSGKGYIELNDKEASVYLKTGHKQYETIDTFHLRQIRHVSRFDNRTMSIELFTSVVYKFDEMRKCDTLCEKLKETEGERITQPRSHSRAEELRFLAELRGERQKPKKKGLFKRRKPNRSRGGDFGIYLLLLIVGLMMVFPLVFSVCSALKPLDELFRFPPRVFPQHVTLDNFSDLFVTMGQSWVPFTRYLFNTFFITFVGTLGHLIIASMAAFVLAKYDFPGGKTFFNIVVTALMFSGYVTGIPNYIIMSRLNMIDTYWAIILPAFAAPIGLFLMKQFMEGIPTSLIEAAHLDGAGEFRIFWSIVMPNVKPAWLTVVIFSVQSLWNTNASTVIYSEAKKTLVYALQQIQAGGIARTGQAAAVTVIVMLVPITIFILSQSQILETMASSGLKD